VEHEREAALEAEDDALAHAPHARHPAARGRLERRHRAAQQVRAADAGAAEDRAREPALEVLHVDDDVGQFGDGGRVAEPGPDRELARP
jgi:hypothetical protein